MAGKTVLGKTLGGLLSDSLGPPDQEEPVAQLRELPLQSIHRGQFQPRLDIQPQALTDLADSIRSQGVVQPIVVRVSGPDRYEIIAGERRFRAAKLAGLTEIPAVIREMTDETALVCALVENVQRQNLNSLEEAKALARLVEEFTLTHQEVATLVGKSRTAVSNSLRLLSLVKPVQDKVFSGELEAGHAKMLVGLTEQQQLSLAEEIVRKGLSVRQTEQRVREMQQAKKNRAAPVDPQIESLQQAIEQYLSCAVNIQHRASGKGKLVIHYNTLDDLRKVMPEIELVD